MGWINISSRTREHHNHPHTIWPSCNRFHIVTVVKVEEELTRISNQSGVSERDIGLPTLHPECWSDIHTQKCFSDCICLRGHWTQDGHAVPCVGFSMSRDHYLKIINQDGFRIIHLNLASWILQRIIWRLYLENPNWNLQQNILKKYQIRTPSGSSGFPEVFLQKQSTGTPPETPKYH